MSCRQPSGDAGALLFLEMVRDTTRLSLGPSLGNGAPPCSSSAATSKGGRGGAAALVASLLSDSVQRSIQRIGNRGGCRLALVLAEAAGACLGGGSPSSEAGAGGEAAVRPYMTAEQGEIALHAMAAALGAIGDPNLAIVSMKVGVCSHLRRSHHGAPLAGDH